MNEIWKDIPGYEGIYQVSNLGNVKSLGNDRTRKEKILKPVINGIGYFNVRLCKNGIPKTITVHKLVAITFLNNISFSRFIVVDHINNNPLDNRFENLQIITNRENLSKDKKNKTSKYTGVSWNKKANKWHSRLNIKNKAIHLGYFNCELAAHIAYINKLKEIV
jgi:hypothetical protein